MEELETLIERLLPNGEPSDAYKDLLYVQREWLLSTGVEEALGLDMVSILKENFLHGN